MKGPLGTFALKPNRLFGGKPNEYSYLEGQSPESLFPCLVAADWQIHLSSATNHKNQTKTPQNLLLTNQPIISSSHLFFWNPFLLDRSLFQRSPSLQIYQSTSVCSGQGLRSAHENQPLPAANSSRSQMDRLDLSKRKKKPLPTKRPQLLVG